MKNSADVVHRLMVVLRIIYSECTESHVAGTVLSMLEMSAACVSYPEHNVLFGGTMFQKCLSIQRAYV